LTMEISWLKGWNNICRQQRKEERSNFVQRKTWEWSGTCNVVSRVACLKRNGKLPCRQANTRDVFQYMVLGVQTLVPLIDRLYLNTDGKHTRSSRVRRHVAQEKTAWSRPSVCQDSQHRDELDGALSKGDGVLEPFKAFSVEVLVLNKDSSSRLSYRMMDELQKSIVI
jgi:hypothetical protein